MKMGFIGTGKIAQAIILGLIKKDKLQPEQIYVSDSNNNYLEYLKDKCPTFKVRINVDFFSNL
jgi:pyrroline-5-carboxylate reductase